MIEIEIEIEIEILFPITFKKQRVQLPAKYFQLFSRIFHLLLVTCAVVQRANSALKLVITVTRSTMHQGRLNASVLLQKDIKLDLQAIIDKILQETPKKSAFH